MGEIHPKAIRQFLERPRDSHVWMKRLKNRELDEMLKEVGFKPHKSDAPRIQKHQKVCILLGIAYKTFAYWLDMGTGKSRIALELLCFFIRKKIIKGALVFGRSESAVNEWVDEVKLWCPDIPILTLLNSSSASKWEELAEFEGGLVLATYPGVARMVSIAKEVKPKKGRKSKQKTKLHIDNKKLKLLLQHIQAYITDESTELGNIHSLQYRVCNRLSKYCPIRYDLAGIPFGRDPTMLWSQMYLLDRGESLGETLGLFRGAMFKTTQNFWGGYEHKFLPKMEPVLNRMLQHRSINYRFEECGELPKLVAKVEEVVLPEEAEAYYQKFVKEITAKNANWQSKNNSFLRMRQVSSGFVGFKNDATGEKAEIEFAVNPKLDRLIELIQQVPHGRKWVVFHVFTYSGKRICQELDKLKIKHGWLHGGIKNSAELQAGYKRGDLDGLVVQTQLGAFSLNLQRGNYYFVYEAPTNPIHDGQMRRRMRRKGQTKTVFGYDLVCRGTADARILRYHQQGIDLREAVMRDPELLTRRTPRLGRK